MESRMFYVITFLVGGDVNHVDHVVFPEAELAEAISQIQNSGGKIVVVSGVEQDVLSDSEAG